MYHKVSLIFIISNIHLFSCFSYTSVLKEEDEPSLYCLKVCPLYCPTTRRSDEYEEFNEDSECYQGTSRDGWEYGEDWPEEIFGDEDLPFHHEYEPSEPHFFAKPYCERTSPKPTTTKPTSSTEEPSFICLLCQKKCRHKKY